MKIASYVLTLLGTILGGVTLFETLLYAESAPQQGAGAAMALAWAVLPYCFARAVEKIGEVPIADALQRYARREEEQATTHDQPRFDTQTGQRLVR